MFNSFTANTVRAASERRLWYTCLLWNWFLLHHILYICVHLLLDYASVLSVLSLISSVDFVLIFISYFWSLFMQSELFALCVSSQLIWKNKIFLLPILKKVPNKVWRCFLIFVWSIKLKIRLKDDKQYHCLPGWSKQIHSLLAYGVDKKVKVPQLLKKQKSISKQECSSHPELLFYILSFLPLFC